MRSSNRIVRGVVIFMIGALFTFGATTVSAAVPSLVNYSGILKNGSGTPLSGTFPVTFAIYSVSGGGTAIWSEPQSVTTNTDGQFIILLGTVTPITEAVFSGPDRYLGITVSPDPEMSPRTRIATVAYAFRPATVDGASGGNITSKVSIGTGHSNTGDDAFVAGVNNTANGHWSAVGGGISNEATGESATIGGGFDNTASGYRSAVSGGWGNNASGAYTTIAGGGFNVATIGSAAVGGGYANYATGIYSTTPGGLNNAAGGAYSFAAGGHANAASGDHSFVAGRRAKANNPGAFVWADDNDADFVSTADNQFLIRAAGNVGINTNGPNSPLHVNGAVATAVAILPVASTTTLDKNNSVLLAATTGGAITINLPLASTCRGREYTIKNIGVGNLTISPTSPDLIDGSASSLGLFSLYQSIVLVSGPDAFGVDQWWIAARHL